MTITPHTAVALAQILHESFDYETTNHAAAMLMSQAAELKSWEAIFTEASVENDALKAENAALRLDAERYRWLRSTTNWVGSKGERIDGRNQPELLDESIDAARAALGEQT